MGISYVTLLNCAADSIYIIQCCAADSIYILQCCAADSIYIIQCFKRYHTAPLIMHFVNSIRCYITQKQTIYLILSLSCEHSEPNHVSILSIVSDNLKMNQCWYAPTLPHCEHDIYIYPCKSMDIMDIVNHAHMWPHWEHEIYMYIIRTKSIYWINFKLTCASHIFVEFGFYLG